MTNQKLLDLLQSGEFDWDNIAHRQAFLKEWASDDGFRTMTDIPAEISEPDNEDLPAQKEITCSGGVTVRPIGAGHGE